MKAERFNKIMAGEITRKEFEVVAKYGNRKQVMQLVERVPQDTLVKWSMECIHEIAEGERT